MPAKQIDILSTNIANLGTEMEKKCRLKAGESENAWQDAGKAPGLLIWRIEQFHVKPVPKDQYGRFYSGDSYIVLNTYKKKGSEKIMHDLHFWLGERTTTDEAGTAAYKTVELDDHLNCLPVQHREIQGFESPLFLSYFPSFVIQNGGADSGFKKVEPEKYRPRLLHIKGVKRNIVIKEVSLSYQSLNSGDVFIADLGLKIFQFNGKSSGPFEKSKAAEFVRSLDDERKGLPTVTVFEEESTSKTSEWWEAIGGYGQIDDSSKIMPAEQGGSDQSAGQMKIKLFRVSDATGELLFKHEVTQPPTKIVKSMLDTNDVFIVDCGIQVYVWMGHKSSKNEKSKGLSLAEEYLIKENRPRTTPIAKITEDGENEHFHQLLK